MRCSRAAYRQVIDTDQFHSRIGKELGGIFGDINKIRNKNVCFPASFGILGFKQNPFPLFKVVLLEFLCLDGYAVIYFDYTGGPNCVIYWHLINRLAVSDSMSWRIHMCTGMYTHVNAG